MLLPLELEMTNQHPITPPPELVSEWTRNRGYSCPSKLWNYIATQAAQWGADQELEACFSWLALNGYGITASRLRAARRPPPPSLKERIAAAITAGDERTALSLLDEALPE